MGKAVFTPTQDAFRFYEDGTESGSSPVAAENTNITRIVDANSDLHLRILIQEVGGASGATTDDWQLQYSLNGGTYTDITTSSTVIAAYNSSNVTNGTTTTNRATNGITDGSGTFVAGEVCEDGLLDNHQLTADNFTEHLYTIRVLAASTADNDTIDFRVLINGATMTYNVTPRITVEQVPTVALNTADDTEFTTATPTLEFTGTDPGGDDVRYNIQINKIETFYFDASDASPIDENEGLGVAWTDDANAFDGSLSTFAFANDFGAALFAEGTNAPSTNTETISSVRARVFGGVDSYDWGSWESLTTPTGGWTWTKLATLETRIRAQSDAGTEYLEVEVKTDNEDQTLAILIGSGQSPSGLEWRAYRVEFEVTYITHDKVSGTDAGFANTVTGGDTDPFNSGEKADYDVQAGDALDNGTYTWRVRAIDPNGSNTYGDWTATRTFTVNVAGEEGEAQIPTRTLLGVGI